MVDNGGNGGNDGNGTASPRSVVVIGAGIVGLSTAWFLQERGIEVALVDRSGMAAGSSWGNAGWISPALTIPLNEPGNVGYGLLSLLSPTAPLKVPLNAKPAVWAFLARFAAHSRRSSWLRAVHANLALSQQCFDAYDALAAGGVDIPVTPAPITALFTSDRQLRRFEAELERFSAAGQKMSTTELSGSALREQVPLASDTVCKAVQVNDQRFVDPGRFVTTLGRLVVKRGARLHRFKVSDVVDSGSAVRVAGEGGEAVAADAAVVATGAWLSELVSRWVRTPVQAGRGYSFTVPTDAPVDAPIYLPDARVACTPIDGRLRVAGTMEFRHPDEPAVSGRVEAIIAAARPLLTGVRWAERDHVWVGPRPVSPDGRPLVGEVVRDRIYVAGGHGMWGMAHGPATGRLLAEQIDTGCLPSALRGFDPLR